MISNWTIFVSSWHKILWHRQKSLQEYQQQNHQINKFEAIQKKMSLAAEKKNYVLTQTHLSTVYSTHVKVLWWST